jgi:hypothetical protein
VQRKKENLVCFPSTESGAGVLACLDHGAPSIAISFALSTLSYFFLFYFLLFPFQLIAQELPVQGRPTFAPFSQAIGQFQVATRAAPTTLQAEDPLIFTIRVSAVGPVVQAPERPDLRELPEFDESFFIEDRTDQDRADDNSWEFVYQLKPRTTAVTSIPGFPLIYYQPGTLPASKGYMTRWSPAIPLEVKPREDSVPNQDNGSLVPADVPATVYQFVNDTRALLRDDSFHVPVAWISLLLIMPPALCLGWYLTWRRLYPDAARLARQRRSKAAQRALDQLQHSFRTPIQAQQVTEIIAQYLRQRLDLPAGEPTPPEIAAHLQKLHFGQALVEKATVFFKQADAARFLPAANVPTALVESGKELILALETESCSP